MRPETTTAPSAPPSSPASAPQRKWEARLRLGFAPRNGRTAMMDMEFFGPLRVQRPFHPEGDPCHCYLLHPPGGLVSGDMLTIEADCAPGAHALLTTPSAGKIYGADSENAPQGQKVVLAARDAVIEWLPMETIVFDRANARLSLDVELSGSARAIGWDVVCLGRPEGGHLFRSGDFLQTLAIARDGAPLLLERLELAGGGDLAKLACGLGGACAFGVLFATGFTEAGAAEALLSPLREMLACASRGRAAATFRRETLILRYIGDCAQEARSLFARSWAMIRPALLGREACPPRIWAT